VAGNGEETDGEKDREKDRSNLLRELEERLRKMKQDKDGCVVVLCCHLPRVCPI